MKKICFVILNYKTYKEAIACAMSVLTTQKYSDINIIIVDNGSPNDSAEQLENYFKHEQRVHVIVSDENLGFAKGNNLGIKYAREHFEPDFIVVANSDIIFEQSDYCEKVVEIYERKPYAILGGDIIDADRVQHFNPVARNRIYTIPYMRKQALVSEGKAWLYRIIKLLHMKKKVENKEEVATREVEGKSVVANSRVEEELENVLLHGCCMVFSKDFFQKLDGFWPETFLYAEEEIIYYLAMKKKLKMVYSPELVCMHKEAVTTKELYEDFCDSKIFYYNNVAKSYWKFYKLMKSYE